MNITIQSTLDYALFSRIASNREINRNHLAKLKKNILNKNLLDHFPIIIDKNMLIVDGQHRLAAAMELKLPIFYIISPNITKADIAMVNSTRKSWGAKDYISFYAREGNEDYAKLQLLMEQFPRVTYMAAVRLVSDNCDAGYTGGGNASLKLKSGEVNANDIDIAHKICSMARKMEPELVYAWAPAFLCGIKNALLRNGGDPDKLLKNLQMNIDKLPLDMEGISSLALEIKRFIPYSLTDKPVKKQITPVEKPAKKAHPIHKKEKDTMDMNDFKEELY